MALHIDEWLDTPTIPRKGDRNRQGEIYAKFVLEFKRMPAWKQTVYSQYMDQFKLYCTYEGKRFRCTGASRMGDVWLTSRFDKDCGYEHRVDVEDCSAWSDSPSLDSEFTPAVIEELQDSLDQAISHALSTKPK